MNKTLLSVVGALALFTLTMLGSQTSSGAGAADWMDEANYIGSEACKKCHLKEHRSWGAEKHSKAWSSLSEKYRDPAQVDESGRSCVSCHTTGYGHGDRGGFVDIATTPSMVDVGCESCHGPGSLHNEAAKALMAQRRKTFDEGEQSFTLSRTTSCVDCHNTHVNHSQYKDG